MRVLVSMYANIKGRIWIDPGEPLPRSRGSDDARGSERPMSQFVYGLYGLTDDRIRIVEEATRR